MTNSDLLTIERIHQTAHATEARSINLTSTMVLTTGRSGVLSRCYYGLDHSLGNCPHQDNPADALVINQCRQGAESPIDDIQRTEGVDLKLVAGLFNGVENIRVERVCPRDFPMGRINKPR